MTDKKFTDEEIKSSLEVIATTHNCNECKIRNCKWGTCNCSQITANAAISLINRQKAEIERLEKREIEIDDFCRRLCRMRMLNGDAIASYGDLQNYIQEAKSEAIKEFTERLKSSIYINTDLLVYQCEEVESVIDDVAEEMVGETK